MQHRKHHLQGLLLRFLRHGRPCVVERCALTGDKKVREQGQRWVLPLEALALHRKWVRNLN